MNAEWPRGGRKLDTGRSLHYRGCHQLDRVSAFVYEFERMVGSCSVGFSAACPGLRAQIRLGSRLYARVRD